jgi:uncharacterized protein
MNQPAKAQEPSMEEILASIRRIIADDDAVKPPKAPEPVAAKPVMAAVPPPLPPKEVPPQPDAAAMSQDDIDAMLTGFDAPTAAPAPPPEPVFAPQPMHEPEPEPEPDILDLTEAMAAPMPPPEPVAPPPVPAFTTISSEPDVFFAEREEPPAPPPRAAAPEPPRHVEPPRQPMPSVESTLMGADTRAAVDAAFNSLAHTVLVQNARTLEDLVKEMLRPMLKSWLDDNLPGMVERIVKAEIERVSRGR